MSSSAIHAKDDLPGLQPEDKGSFTFGQYQLDVQNGTLTRSGSPVRLTARLERILRLLVQNAGLVVSFDQLEAAIAVKSESSRSSLRVYVSALNSLLGAREDGGLHVLNEHGRGYRFVVSVTRSASLVHDGGVPTRRSVAPLIGRDALLAKLAVTIATCRLVSLVGPGGIGKSSLANAYATSHSQSYRDGVHLFDFTLVEDPRSIAAFVAEQLQVSPQVGSGEVAIALALGKKRVLLIFDNCEHVLEPTAVLAERLLSLSPHVDILVTSREALKANGERVFRVPALEVPTDQCTADDAVHFSAVQLFAERAAANSSLFRVTDDNVQTVVEICRRLDGLPLALELASAWVEFFGLEELARGLDGHFFVRAAGRRMGVPRHQTLVSMIEWSFDALSSGERTTLLRCSIFRGSFNLVSAISIAGDSSLNDEAVSTAIGSLAAKSLVTVDLSYPTPRYRLLETTRQVVFRKLAAASEYRDVQRRYAARCVELLKGAEAVLARVGREMWVKLYRILAADTLAAIDWAFSDTGDIQLGIKLTGTSAIFGEHFFMHREYEGHIRRALELMHKRPAKDRSLEQELKLTLIHFLGLSGNPEAAYVEEENADPETEFSESGSIKGLAARWFAAWVSGRYLEAKEAASAMIVASDHSGDFGLQMASRKSMAQTLHFLGHHAEAKRLAEVVIDSPFDFLPLSNVSHKVSLRIILARIAFIQGDGAGAADHLETLASVREEDNFMALAQILAFAQIPISMWAGDLVGSANLTAQLADLSRRHEMGIWAVLCEQVKIAIELRNGALKMRPLTAMGFNGAASVPLVADLTATLEPRLLCPSTVERVSLGHVGWCAPEVIRVAALKLSDESERRDRLRAGLDRAAQQGALLWENRIREDLQSLESNACR